MARPTVQRSPGGKYSLGAKYPPGIEVKPVPMFKGSKGLNFRSRLFDTPNEQPAFAKNWRTDRGTWIQRPGTDLLGPGVNSEILHITEFQLSGGTKYVIRFTQTTVDTYDQGNNVWISATGPALALLTSDAITSSGWADKMMFQVTNGNLYQLDISTIPATYVQIATGPVTVGGTHVVGKHVTTFAGRAIISGADFPYRIAWSTKNDNTNWVGTGSGYEDLYSTPGGNADAVLGVYPVTDEQAIVVRTRSVWLMSVTGVADVPFRFSRLYDNIACESPKGIANVPGGIVEVGMDEIYYITPQSIQALGEDIRPRVYENLVDFSSVVTAYDQARGAFVFGCKEGNVALINVLWQYSFYDKGWTRDEYAFGIKCLAYSRYLIGSITIDSLPGTIDSLVGTIDNLGATAVTAGLLLSGKATTGAQSGYGFVLRENMNTSTDWNTAFDTVSEIPYEVRSSLLNTGDDGEALSRILMNEVQVEYSQVYPSGITFSPQSVAAVIEVSFDGAQTWQTFSSGNSIPAAPMPDVYRFAGSIEAPQMQVRMTNPKMRYLRLNTLYCMLVMGARQFP